MPYRNRWHKKNRRKTEAVMLTAFVIVFVSSAGVWLIVSASTHVKATVDLPRLSQPMPPDPSNPGPSDAPSTATPAKPH
jgi:hypothetical protein